MNDMLTIIMREDGDIEVMGMPWSKAPHIVIVNEAERWTDSPSIMADTSADEQAEQIAAYRNEGYEDRNP